MRRIVSFSRDSKRSDLFLFAGRVFIVAGLATFAPAQSTQPVVTSQPVVAGQPVVASQPVVTTSPSDPGALAKDLSNPDWRVRRSAREALVRMGDEAIPTLQSLVQTAPDEEARQQAQEALSQIEQNRTLGPSYLTLHLKDAKPQDVFAEISRQCHATLAPYPDNLWMQGNLPKLTIDVDRKPFWEVVPGICQRLGVDLRQYQTGLRIMRTGMNMMNGVTQVSGPFLVVADRIQYTRTRSLGGNRGENTSFSMSMTLYPEPKITMLRGITSLKLLDAVDDHGNSLLPPPQARIISSGGFGAGAAQLFAPLQYPKKNAGTKMTRFRADATFSIQTKTQQVQVPDILHVKNYHVSLRDLEFTVRDLAPKAGNYELHLSIVLSPTAPAEFRNVYELVQNNLRLLDGQGIELPHHGMSSNQRNDTFDLNLMFGNTPANRPPEKIVWDLPLESKKITVPISFSDIPLFEN